MIKITNNKETKIVTKGAYNSFYKPLGFKIVGESTINKEVKEQPKKVQEIKEEPKKVEEIIEDKKDEEDTSIKEDIKESSKNNKQEKNK